jgi:hypothetical protein
MLCPGCDFIVIDTFSYYFAPRDEPLFFPLDDPFLEMCSGSSLLRELSRLSHHLVVCFYSQQGGSRKICLAFVWIL